MIHGGGMGKGGHRDGGGSIRSGEGDPMGNVFASQTFKQKFTLAFKP